MRQTITICDKCKKEFRVASFLKPFEKCAWHYKVEGFFKSIEFDLCEECEAELKTLLKDFIGEGNGEEIK